MRQLLRRAWYVIRRRRFEADLAEEMACHRAMKERELVEGGENPRDAAFLAQRTFGSTALARDQARDVWMWTWWQDLGRDARFATRVLVKDCGFTFAAVTVLALGIGANNTLSVLVDAICLRGLPIDRPERVLFLTTHDGRNQELGLSYREFIEARSGAPGFAGVAAFAAAPVAVGDEGRAPDRALSLYLSATAFRLLGEKPQLGRDFNPDDDVPGAQPVAILAGGLWKARYGGDPSIVGRAIRINGRPTIVVGIMRETFRFPATTDVWQPLALMPGLAAEQRNARTLSVFGRLAEGILLADVRGQLKAVAARLARDYPDTNRDVRIAAVPINERYNGRITDTVWLQFITAGLIVLLVACANAANLLLMRAVNRAHEMATRAALGATRGQLVRQLLTESALLAAFGGGVGLVLSLLGLRLLRAMVPADTMPYWMTFTMDGRVLVALCIVCLGTVAVFGLAPALHVSKTDVNQAMREGGRTGTGTVRARRWTTAFLTAEFGLTMVLLAGFCMNMESARRTTREDRILAASDLLTTLVSLSPDKYPTPGQRAGFFNQLEQRLEPVRAVTSVAVASTLPLGGAALRQLAIDGPSSITGETPPTVGTVTVSRRYFETLGVPLVRGRAFSPNDGAAAAESAIVNQRFADLYLPNADPIGRRIRTTNPGAANAIAPWMRIVGVSATVRQRPQPDPEPIVYFPLQAAPPATATVMLRTSDRSASVAQALREIVRSMDPDLPLYRLMSMGQALAESQWNGRMSNVIANSLTFIALALAAVGLYAVTGHAVGQRTHEIGVRVALGARPAQLVAMVLKWAMVQLGLALAAGIGCIFAWQRLWTTGVSTVRVSGARMDDPVVLIAVSAAVTLVAAIACIAPARRAIRLDPVVALRHE
jgi:putative ABC transport system permease protein